MTIPDSLPAQGRESLIPLARLGLWALEQAREFMAIEPWEAQEKAQEFGVIESVLVPKSCSDDPDSGCPCDEFADQGEARDCLRDTEATVAAKALLSSPASEREG